MEKAHYLIIHFDQAVMHAPTDGNVSLSVGQSTTSGPDKSISKTIKWIGIKYCADIKKPT